MTGFNTNFLLIALMAILIVGCSGSSTPATPDSPTPDSIDSQDNPYVAASDSRQSWGAFDVFLDIGNLAAIVEPAQRNSLSHFDVTNMLTPPNCDDCIQVQILDYDPVAYIAGIKIILKNPSSLAGYDVRTVLYNYDFKQFLGVDGYTDIWSPSNEELPYYYFAIDNPERMFGAYEIHNRVFNVYVPLGASYNYTIGVDASWPGPSEDDELDQVKVVSQYRWVTDPISQMRGLDEVIDIFKETKTDFIFQGWLTQWYCPETCSDLPTEELRQLYDKKGYSYEYLRNAISEIKSEIPDIIFSGGMQAEYLYPDEVSGDTDQERKDNAWNMALDPSKWGIDISKRDMQCYWAKRFGVVEKNEECPDEEYLKEEMRKYFPDLTNPDFQEAFLNRAYRQIDAGADAIWIDMLYVQANLLKDPYFEINIDENHPFVQESHEAASKIVDCIHEYGQMKGRYIYVITWVVVLKGGSIIQLHPEPNVDIAMTSPESNEVLDRASGNIGQFNEEEWIELVEIIEETVGIPIFARIDYGGNGRGPLNVFSQELTKEQQREFLIKADTFFSDIGINFIYPIHGGDMGPPGQVTRLSYGFFNWYDALAPEFETYETIVELAQIKAER